MEILNVADNSNEGLVFVPRGGSPGRYGGDFFWSEQAKGKWRRFTLDAASTTVSWIDSSAAGGLSFPSGCSLSGDLSDGM